MPKASNIILDKEELAGIAKDIMRCKRLDILLRVLKETLQHYEAEISPEEEMSGQAFFNGYD